MGTGLNPGWPTPGLLVPPPCLGCVLACLPRAQHWARPCVSGASRAEQSPCPCGSDGLAQRSHPSPGTAWGQAPGGGPGAPRRARLAFGDPAPLWETRTSAYPTGGPARLHRHPLKSLPRPGAPSVSPPPANSTARERGRPRSEAAHSKR